MLGNRVQVNEVFIHGKRCPRVDKGNSMRLAMMDISGVPNAKIGDMVCLHGCCNAGSKQEEGKPLNFAAVSINVPRIPKW